MPKAIRALKNDAGSITPLVIALATLSLALILTVSSLASAFLLQRRLTTFAEAQALSKIIDVPVLQSPIEGVSLQVSSEDQVTVEVRACAPWNPPLNLGPMLKFIKQTQILCGSGRARLGR